MEDPKRESKVAGFNAALTVNGQSVSITKPITLEIDTRAEVAGTMEEMYQRYLAWLVTESPHKS